MVGKIANPWPEISLADENFVFTLVGLKRQKYILCNVFKNQADEWDASFQSPSVAIIWAQSQFKSFFFQFIPSWHAKELDYN